LGTLLIGLQEALRLTLDNIKPLADETVAVLESVDRIASKDVYSLVDSPSLDVSLKDGYALICHDVAAATPENPVQLRLAGFLAAGAPKDKPMRTGTTVKVMTGARIPTGAEAVVPEENVEGNEVHVRVKSSIERGCNILPRGRDVAFQNLVLRSGQQITPGLAGLLVAAGHESVPVVKQPVVGIIATGDEIVAPGTPMEEGKLYASNIATLAAWCRKWKMKSHLAIVRDDPEAILNVFNELSVKTDALMTSGGAWIGDCDLTAQILQQLGWKQIFHRVRMGPGKAVGLGLLNGKPVFVLPGGPPSNLMAFLQIALPGLQALAGHVFWEMPRVKARLASGLKGKDPDWTDFFYGTIDQEQGIPIFYPLKHRSRLSSMAEAEAVASIPEGREGLPKGSEVWVQLLR
jgi:molybdopterin molybdotransferase